MSEINTINELRKVLANEARRAVNLAKVITPPMAVDYHRALCYQGIRDKINRILSRAEQGETFSFRT